ncbi:hypothetical protein LTR37_017169 [Vermiconidia calcicola]|uniref:Uncharacterized protein n=1 Tax=Vermiconidia calcicola TaxID=1690605 RepID=A0ACC3MM87_9PEZI|nr:hypothetical protein LTR37_017169 [Vermiconidia calcicola]
MVEGAGTENAPHEYDHSSTKEDSVLSHENEGPTSSSQEQPAPPDGGLYGWLVVLGACFVFFNTWGLVQAFGAYQSYYTTNTLRENNASTISWIGTIQAWLLVSVGVISGPIFDQGYLRTLVFAGSSMIVFGVMMLSLARSYYQILLAQSICIGLGSGLLFTPSVAQVTVTFSAKRRPLALGLSMVGTGAGGIVFPIVFNQLEPRIGFGWTTRVIGFISLATLSISVVSLSWKRTPRKPPRALFEMSALKQPTFVIYGVSAFLVFTAYWVPWFFIPLYGEFGVGATATFSSYLLAITNACGIVGRLITPLFQRRFTSLQTILIMTILGDILIWSWISIHTIGSFVVFCVFWGLFTGPLAVLPASAVADLSPNLNSIGTRIGMIWFFSSFGNLIGAPIAGAVSNPTQNDFLGGQAYAGACMAGSAVLTAAILFLLHADKSKKREN